MTTQRHARRNRTAPKPASKNRLLPLAATFAVAIAVIGGIVWLFAGDGDVEGNGDAAAAGVPLPIENLPQTVLSMQVSEPAVDRGRLPLDTTVTQVYEIVNTGDGAAEIGQPTIEVLDGCCPPQPQVSQTMVGAGQKSTVSVSMQMHKGMDGPHLFHLTVPVRNAEGEDALHLYFKGDFRG